MNLSVMFTLRASNVKTGPIPVSTTSRDTCATSCPLFGDGGCYAASGNLGMLWRALSGAVPGEKFRSGVAMVQSYTWSGFVAMVAALPEGTLWRHNQAGDLPGQGDAIDV